MNTWTHQSLSSPEQLDSSPSVMSPKEAQYWVNFVVHQPTWIPEDTTEKRMTVRKEAPPGKPTREVTGRTPWSASNPSAVRLEVEGPQRRLRIKQFLYDWAFPALDHPALWESTTVPTISETKPDVVIWHGLDYERRVGASARMHRTNVELSVLEGEFSREEITRIYQGLEPVVPAVAELVADTAFASLSYWARYETPAVGVPVGLWKIRQPGQTSLQWTSHRRSPVSRTPYPAFLHGLHLDSSAKEVGNLNLRRELLYLGGDFNNREVRVHVYNSAPHPVEPEGHPHSATSLQVDEWDVSLAWISEDVGPFDAICVRKDAGEGGPAYRVLSSSSVHHDKDWFCETLRVFLRSVEEVRHA